MTGVQLKGMTMRRQSVQMRTYLLLNLVLLAVLLIVLWRGDPTGVPGSDLAIRFPALILVLLILNTVLFFRDYLRPSQGSQKPSGKRALALLASEVLADAPDESVVKRVLLKVAAECHAEAGFFLAREEVGAPEKRPSSVGASPSATWGNDCPALTIVTGRLHPSLASGRFMFSGTDLHFRHPGGLGEELIWSSSAGSGFHPTVSRIGRFRLSVLPVRFSGQVVGWFAFQPNEERPLRQRVLDEAVILFQGLGALWFQQWHASAGAPADPVSGLPGAEAFQEAIEIELERSERYSQNLTLMQLTVVPQAGSAASPDDQILAAASQAVKDSLRRLDQAFVSETRGRFSALLTETTPDVAKLVAERIHTAFLRRISQKESGKASGLVLRMGSATYPGDASHTAGLCEKADEALQQALARGQSFVTYAGIDSGDSSE